MDENLRSLDLTLNPAEIREMEAAVAEIKIVGDRYPAESQRQISR